MEQNELRELEKKCVQDDLPSCNAACPVHVDVKGFVKRLQNSDMAGALKVFSRSVPFPRIISRICDHPCQDACRRQEVGDSIAINALERVCVEAVEMPAAKPGLIMKRQQRVAVIGGGLSGLTTALELAKKGYPVVIIEKQARLGGRLLGLPEEVLPGSAIAQDIEVLKNYPVEIRFNTVLGQGVSLEGLLGAFNTVFLGLGIGADSVLDLRYDDRGGIEIDPFTLATSREGVFAGGSLRTPDHPSYIGAVSDGRRAAISIDRFLQQVSITAGRVNEGRFESGLYVNLEGIEPMTVVVPTDPGIGFSQDEAAREAGRCLQCECMECVKVCEYLSRFKNYPKKYVREVYNNLSIVLGNHPANKLINSCSLCGLCQEVCPQGFPMGEVCRKAREEMFGKGKMPPSAHDFPLQDMEFSNSENCVLALHQPGHDASGHLFFPGCQLTASTPEHVERVYSYLTGRIEGGVGLMLRCCGAPAEWSGRSELFQAGLREIESQWREMGKPKLITACSTCSQMFEKYLPEVEKVSLWEVYERFGLPEVESRSIPETLAVHDACTSRHNGLIQESVRGIIKKLGCRVEELPTSRETTECCGFGGLMRFANRELAEDVIRRRCSESDSEYVVYCAMCRDSFASQGKKTYHLLDLIYGTDDPEQPAIRGPGYSQRRDNRVRLKQRMLNQLWGDQWMKQSRSFESIKLEIPDQVREVLEQRMILLEDVQQVIEYAEKTGCKLIDPDSGFILANHRAAHVTYWVEYTPQEGFYILHNAYSHRMEVEGNQ